MAPRGLVLRFHKLKSKEQKSFLSRVPFCRLWGPIYFQVHSDCWSVLVPEGCKTEVLFPRGCPVPLHAFPGPSSSVSRLSLSPTPIFPDFFCYMFLTPAFSRLLGAHVIRSGPPNTLRKSPHFKVHKLNLRSLLFHNIFVPGSKDEGVVVFRGWDDCLHGQFRAAGIPGRSSQ